MSVLVTNLTGETECAGDEFDLDIEKGGWNECAGNNFNLDDEFDLGEKGRNMISLTNS